MESLFKVGDKVFLPEYGPKGWECEDWAIKAGIPLNTSLEVEKVNVDGDIDLKDYQYCYPQSKFKPISELYADINKVDLFECDGMEFAAVINDHSECRGKISIVNGELSLAQDVVEGMNKGNYGYKYSWFVGSKAGNFNGETNKKTLFICGVTNFKLIYNTNNMEQIKITRDNFKRIHEIACSAWKAKLERVYSNVFTNPFYEDGILTTDQVDEMLKASTPSQLEVLNCIFKEYITEKDRNPVKHGALKEVTVSELSKQLFGDAGSLQITRNGAPNSRPDLKFRSLWIGSNYEIKIHTASTVDGSIIEFIEK